MSVIAVDKATKTITVKRGMNGTKAKTHTKGLRIAPILRFWAGSYIMNLTNDCPKAKLHGAQTDELYSDYSFRMSRWAADEWWWDLSGDQDGFLFDLMADKITWTMLGDTRCIDMNQDNVSDNLGELDAKWKAGIDHVTELFHAEFPGQPIVRNQSRARRYAEYNGENFESWPHNQWDIWDSAPRGRTRHWHRLFFGDPAEERGGVLEFAKQAAPPNYTLIATCDLETDIDIAGHPELKDPIDRPFTYKPDYSKMRWGLTSALMAGIYYCWVIHTDGHGLVGLVWFDEYDAAGMGKHYLGQPKGEMQKIVTDTKVKNYGCWGREFEGGYVICNPLNYAVDAPLPPGEWKRIQGTQDKLVNNGAVEQGKVKVGAYDGLILLRWPGPNATPPDKPKPDKKNLPF